MLRDRSNMTSREREQNRSARASLFDGIAAQEGPSEGHEQQVEFMEKENERQVDELAGKVSFLKSMTVEIDSEVRGHNALLDDMGGDVDTTRGMLGSAREKLKTVVSSATNKQMCYVVLFVVAVFFILYFMWKMMSGPKSQTSS